MKPLLLQRTYTVNAAGGFAHFTFSSARVIRRKLIDRLSARVSYNIERRKRSAVTHLSPRVRYKKIVWSVVIISSVFLHYTAVGHLGFRTWPRISQDKQYVSETIFHTFQPTELLQTSQYHIPYTSNSGELGRSDYRPHINIYLGYTSS